MKELIKKLENVLGSLREEVEKNDGSTISTIVNTVKSGFDNIKGSILSNEKAKDFVDSINKHMDDFETAIKKSDRKISAKAIKTMEKALKELKDKTSKANKTDKGKPKANTKRPKPSTAFEKAVAEAIKNHAPNKSTVTTVGKHQTVPIAKPKKIVVDSATKTPTKASKPAAKAATKTPPKEETKTAAKPAAKPASKASATQKTAATKESASKTASSKAPAKK